VQATLRSPRFQRRAAITAGLIVLGIVAIWFASRIPRTLAVFTVAAFIAFGVQPIVKRLERWMPRAAAIAIVYLGLIGLIVILSVLVVPALIEQVQVLGYNAPSYIASGQGWIDGAQTWLKSHLSRSSNLAVGSGDLKGLLQDKLSAWLAVSLASLSNILINTFTVAFVVVSAVVLSAFFLFRGEHVADAFYGLIPERRRPNVRALTHQMAHVFGAYVSGQAALCVIVGTFIFAICAAIGCKFALLLGILCGIGYAVPFVGGVFSQVLGAVLAAPQGGQMVLWVSLTIFGVARFADNLLVPKIMSESVGVSPIVVMFSVFAGGELFGIAGLLLGIPAAALIKVAWQFVRAGGFSVVEDAANDAAGSDALVADGGPVTAPVLPAPSVPAH
jgi:predicted PurR-regulated permease PerM